MIYKSIFMLILHSLPMQFRSENYEIYGLFLELKDLFLEDLFLY